MTSELRASLPEVSMKEGREDEREDFIGAE